MLHPERLDFRERREDHKNFNQLSYMSTSAILINRNENLTFWSFDYLTVEETCF